MISFSAAERHAALLAKLPGRLPQIQEAFRVWYS
jgi:hypothetical protein